MTVMGDGVMRWAIFTNKQCPMEHKRGIGQRSLYLKIARNRTGGSTIGTCCRRLAIVRGGRRTISWASFESGGLSRRAQARINLLAIGISGEDHEHTGRGEQQGVGSCDQEVNNVGKEDFSQIPYAKIRMFEGTPQRVNSVFASYNVAAEPAYAGKRALILAKLYKRNGEWKFDAIGDPVDDSFLGQTIHRIVQSYL